MHQAYKITELQMEQRTVLQDGKTPIHLTRVNLTVKPAKEGAATSNRSIASMLRERQQRRARRLGIEVNFNAAEQRTHDGGKH